MPATKQHFNLLIFHYALAAPPSTLYGRKTSENVLSLFTESRLIEKRSLRLHNLLLDDGEREALAEQGEIFNFLSHKDLIRVDFTDGKKQVSAELFDF